MRIKLTFFLILLLAQSNSAIANSNISDTIKEGRTLITSGKSSEAYDLLFAAFLEEPGNLDLNFFLGRAAYEKGDYEAALMAFERILFWQPASSRIKLEIARTYMALGANVEAKKNFYEVLATNPPLAVRQNINVLLAAIASSEQKHFITGSISLGVSFDDNIQASPVSDRIQIGLLEITLTGESASPQSDEIFNTTTVASYIYKATDLLSWKTTALNYNAWYDGNNDLDINFFGISSGPVWQKNNWVTDLYLYNNRVNLDYDRYMNITGIGSTGSILFGPSVLVSTLVKFEKKRYDNLNGKNATNIQAIVSPSYTIGSNRLVLSLLAERENAETGVNSYDRTRWKVRYERYFPADVTLYTSFSERQSDYDEKDSLFNVERSDTVQEIVAGLSKTIWKSEDLRRRILADFSHTYTESDSNMDLYNYRKNVTSTLVSYIF